MSYEFWVLSWPLIGIWDLSFGIRDWVFTGPEPPRDVLILQHIGR